MFEIFNNLTYSSADNFPQNECVIQNEREPSVFDSDRIYQVLYIDIRFKDDKFLAFAKPYIWKDEDGTARFGWVSATTSEVFGNVENSCQFYDEFVVGFIPSNNKTVEADRRLFEQYKATIDSELEKFYD